MSKEIFQIEREFDGEWKPTVTNTYFTESEAIKSATWLAEGDSEGAERRVTTWRDGRKVIVHTTNVHRRNCETTFDVMVWMDTDGLFRPESRGYPTKQEAVDWAKDFRKDGRDRIIIKREHVATVHGEDNSARD